MPWLGVVAKGLWPRLPLRMPEKGWWLPWDDDARFEVLFVYGSRSLSFIIYLN